MTFSLNYKGMVPFVICLLGLSLFALVNEPIAKEEVDYLAKMGVQRLVKAMDAPNFDISDLEGGMRSLKEFRGQLVLLNSWATW